MDYKQMTDAELIRHRDAVDAELRTRTTPVKIVHNTCYGGFNLSGFAEDILQATGYNCRYIESIMRNHPVLVAMIERYGSAINGDCADLRVTTVHVPLGYTWRINDYDGMESVYVEPGQMPAAAVLDDEAIKSVLDKAAEWPRNRRREPRKISTGWSDDSSSGSDDD